MHKANSVSNADIVYLNVGGIKMATKRATLCQVEGSLLASMFSGRWTDNIDRDEDGHVFLDFNPKLFALVLDYLRAKKIETPNKPAVLSTVALEDTVNFRSLVDYLGIENIQKNSPASDDNGVKYQFEFHSDGIELEENGTVATYSLYLSQHEFAIGKSEVQATGQSPWRLRLNQANGVFVGVLDTYHRDKCISNSLTKRVTNNTCESPSTWNGSYGWVLGDNSQMCSNGTISPTPNYGSLGTQSHTIELHIANSSLCMLLRPSGLKLSISLPNNHAITWQCLIGLCHLDDGITILP